MVPPSTDTDRCGGPLARFSPLLPHLSITPRKVTVVFCEQKESLTSCNRPLPRNQRKFVPLLFPFRVFPSGAVIKRSAWGLPVRGEGFSHHHRDDDPGEEGHATDDTDGPGDPEQVGQDPGQQRPDSVSTVAPEPVDAHCRGTPVRVGDISNRR